MGFWGRAGLLALGAAAGYLGSRRGQVAEDVRKLAGRGQELVRRTTGDQRLAQRPGTDARGGIMDRLWDSPAARPVKAGMLKAMRFAANVRAGMQEKEQELNQRYADQKQDLRPGSLDTWDAPAGHPRDADLPPGFLTGPTGPDSAAPGRHA